MSDAPDLKVVPLPAPTPESQALIETLRLCLARAEAGDIEAFVLVATRRDRTILRAHARSDKADAFKLLGVLTHESRWLSTKIDEQNAIEVHAPDDPA